MVSTSFLHNPYWQSSRIIIILCKYYLVTSDTLIGSCMCFYCCSLRESKKKRLSYRKKNIEEFVWRTLFFLAARPPSYVAFCHFFHPLQFYVEKKLCSNPLFVYGPARTHIFVEYLSMATSKGYCIYNIFTWFMCVE